MAYLVEHIYNGHDNTVALQLLEGGAPFPLDNVTRITITVGGGAAIVSDNGVGELILWDGEGYAVGEIRLQLGGAGIAEGEHGAWLVVYDDDHENGIVWTPFVLEAHADVEGTIEEEGP